MFRLALDMQTKVVENNSDQCFHSYRFLTYISMVSYINTLYITLKLHYQYNYMIYCTVKIVNIIIYSSFLTSNTEQEIYYFDGRTSPILVLVLTISNWVDSTCTSKLVK